MKKRPVSVKSQRRILFIFAALVILLTALLFRVAWIQIVKGEEYSDMAKDQQKSDIPIEAERGSIYDRNGQELATSITCYTLWVRPSEIRTYYKEDKRSEIASELALILDMDAAEITEKFESEEVLLKIKKYLDKDTADKVRALEISGLELSEDTKRYYPLGQFAATILGSVDDDGNGRTGLELQYDEYLSGVAGRAVMDTDASGNKLAFGESTVYEAENGLNVVLTIDEYLQTMLEKSLTKGLEDTEAKYVGGIAYDPNTGEILAMAVEPSYDPNDPLEPVDEKEREAFNAMTDEEQGEYLSQMWRNPLISDVYEPGSTLKLITTSAALEEGIITPETTFECKGYYTVGGINIYDFAHAVHGTETTVSAVGNSCNPFHMWVASQMGVDTYYKYLDLYGLRDITGVDYPGEASPVVIDKEDVGPVELASMGFGQSLAITPIRLISAEAAIANDGVIMQPHFLKALTDEDGNVVAEYEPQEVRKVISEETASEMLDIMYQQVESYAGTGMKIEGYKIGGKTGSGDQTENGQYTDRTTTSYICVAPIDDPKIVVLIVCNSIVGKTATSTAIPIARDYMQSILSYLEISPTEESNELSEGYAYVPDVTGMTYSEAAAELESYGLSCELIPALTDEESKDTNLVITVVDQYPKAGSKIKKDEKVYLYRE
jgi:stage V sporulation protein D (sporulation-specific penicillin-binding protein)